VTCWIWLDKLDEAVISYNMGGMVWGFLGLTEVPTSANLENLPWDFADGDFHQFPPVCA
jgi:hypothetical protein